MRKVSKVCLIAIMSFAVVICCTFLSMKSASAFTDTLNDQTRAYDKALFDIIDEQNPQTEKTVKYRKSANSTSDDGSLCNASAMADLLNRRLVADGYASSFSISDVLLSIGHRNPVQLYINGGGKNTNHSLYQYWTFTVGPGSSWCVNNKKYTNSEKSYTITQISGSTARKNAGSNKNITAYFAQLLHEHPEGFVARFKYGKSGHVVAFYRYEYSNGKYTLYVKENVGAKSGSFFSMNIGKTKVKSEAAMYSQLDFIVYLNGKTTLTPYEPVERSLYRTNKQTVLYTSLGVSSNTLNIYKDIGVIVVGKTTVNNILWYRTADGFNIKADDVYFVEKAPEIGGYKEVASLTIKAKEITQKTSCNLKDEPYSHAKTLDIMPYNVEYTITGLYINSYNNYWVSVEKNGRKFFICVDNIVRTDADNSNDDVTINGKNYAPTFKVTDGSVFPNGNRKKGSGYELRGKISSPYTIKTAQGFVISFTPTSLIKTEKQSKMAIINNTSFDLQKSCVNVAKNGGIAFGTLSEGYKLFRLDICYVKNAWHDVTNCKENPLKQQEFTRKFYSLFTVGTKYNNSNNPLGALMVASVSADDPTEPESDVEPVTLSADISVKPSKIEYKGLKYKIDYQSKTATFLGCKDKKADSIVIPSTVENDGETFKVTTIAKEACKDMPNLEKLTIGKNIEAIGEEAFRDCKNLRKIIIKTTKLTSKNVGKKAFKGIDKKATISCPDSELQNYKEFLVKKGIPKAAFE